MTTPVIPAQHVVNDSGHVADHNSIANDLSLLFGTAVVGMGSAAVITTSATPIASQKNRYSAASGNLVPVLPALSGLSAGPTEYPIEKDMSDTSANTVTVTCASGDTFESGATSILLNTPSEFLVLMVVAYGGNKYWAVKNRGLARSQGDIRYTTPGINSLTRDSSGRIASITFPTYSITGIVRNLTTNVITQFVFTPVGGTAKTFNVTRDANNYLVSVA